VLSLLLTLTVIALLYYVGFGLAVWLTQAGDDHSWTYTRMPFWGFGFSAISLLYLGQMNIPTRTGIWMVLALATLVNLLALRYRRTALRENLGRFRALLLTPSIILLTLVAWPAVWVGLEYMSYFNEDMWRYSIVAEWLSQHGYFDPPGSQDFARNFVHADAVNEYSAAHYRILVEYFLSGIISLSGGHWQGRKLFTPVIVSFAFIAPQAVFAFARDVLKLSARPASGVAVLFALLSTYQWGIYHQLLAQSMGIPLMLLMVAEYAVYKSTRSWVSVCRLAGLTLMVALAYPEILPFATLPIGADVVYSLASRAVPGGQTIRHMAALGVAVPIAAHINTWYLSSFLFRQLEVSVSMSGTYAFPYFFRASGLPALYGLVPITSNLMGTKPWTLVGYWSLVGVGLVLSVVTLWGGWRLLREKNIPAVFLLIALLVAWLFFYARRTDFGLFKTSLFISPVLIIIGVYGVLSDGELSKFRKRGGPTMLMSGIALLWVGCNLFVSLHTSLGSFVGGQFGGTVALAPRGLSEIHDIEQYFPAGSKVVLATRLYNPLEWMSTLLPRLDQVLVVPPPWRFGAGFLDPPSSGDWDQRPMSAEGIVTVDRRVEDLFKPFSSQGLLWSGELFSLYRTEALYPWILPFSTRQGKLVSTKKVYSAEPIGLHALERRHGRPISWMGSNLALRILAARPESVRLVVAQSNTVLRQPLPDSDVHLNHNVLERVSTGGYGERRKISRPFHIHPDGRGAITAGRIDLAMHAVPTLIPSLTEPLLFGGTMPQDLRMVTTLLSDMFLVREPDFQARRVPTAFTVQEGIQNRLLECGGFYEDGWVGRVFWTELHRRLSDTELVIRGLVPGNVGVTFPMVVTAMMDDSPIGQQAISQAGDFVLAFKLAPPPTSRVVKIRVEFSQDFFLPNNDGRLASARLYEAGFQ
jgi:hypothetical protein